MGLSLAAKFNLLFILPALPVIYFMLPFKKIRLLTVTILGYCFAWCGFVIGNGISFIFLWRHNFFTNMNMFFTYIIGILYSNLNMSSKAANTTQISSAWSWFTIPQILTFYRLYYKAQAQVSTVVGFQNPVLFLLTIPAVCIIIYLLIRKKIRKPTSTVIILLYFFGQYLPWLFNIRPTYYYYIFPLIPLIIFLVVRVVGLLPKKTSQNIMVMLAVTSSLFFLAYYPMLIGLNISIRRENISFLYSRYHYPKVNTLFCQFCSPR
jgi:dolichyl-phosphate-mannose--protein O-mannosyl transferase